jgi:hypothetical protein
MKGKYIFKSDGKIIAEKENILTGNGIYMINQYLADSSFVWAGTIGVGAYYTVAASTDTTLSYEFARAQISLKTYQTTSGSNEIIIKATLDPSVVGSIYEIGVFPKNLVAGLDRDNYLVTGFDELYGTSASSDWLTGSSIASAINPIASSSSRVGLYSLALSTTVSGSVITRPNFALDLTDYSTNTQDFLSLLYSVSATGTTPSAYFIFTDYNGNNWQSVIASLNTAASGVYTASFLMNSIPTSSYAYDNITTITASIWGGATGVIFDSLKFMSGDLKNPEQKLVSKTSSSAAIVTKTYNQPMEIEYHLTVT